MGQPDEFGMVREGFLADLVLVDGGPAEDVSILQDADKLHVIMKDGQFHKSTVDTAIFDSMSSWVPAA